MEIDKNKDYQIIVFANQDEGLKAQRILIRKSIDFKSVSTLALVVTEEKRQEICKLLLDEGVIVSGYYKFLPQDYEEEFFKKVRAYRPAKTEDRFLESVTLCYVAPCVADETKIRLIAYFSCDISEIMPYLNTVIKGASYNKNAPTLIYTKAHRVINLYNIKVTIAKANDIIDAWETLDEIKNLINRTYCDRDKIEPNYEQRVKVGALEIYGWLPKTNCKACGEAACLAFAVKLLQGAQKLKNCTPLVNDPKFSEKKKALEEIVEALGV